MDGTEALKVIDTIADTSSKTKKHGILARFIGDPFFARVLTAALDPFVTYGVKKMPKIAEYGTKELTMDSVEWATLDALAVRSLTGEDAQTAIVNVLTTLNEASAELFRRMLLKDLRAGFSRNSVNKVKPGMIATFDCMLAYKYQEKRIEGLETVAVEPKLDGVRVLAFVSANGVGFYSRSGKPYTTFDHLMKPLQVIGNSTLGVVIDGEVVSGSFNKTVGDVRRKDEQATDAVFYVFDVVPAELFRGDKGNESKKGYKERRQIVEMCVAAAGSPMIKTLPRYLASGHDEVMAYYMRFRERGLEGAIVKSLDGTYQRKRSYNWLKIKDQQSVDVPVTGAFEGTGKYEGMLGGLIVDVDGVEVRVGGGFSDEQRAEFWKAWQSDVGHPMYGENPAVWPASLVGRLIEVGYHEKTLDGSLRHPRFVRFRPDKEACEDEAA